jgi:heme-degrading monooxygenase HmoA
VDQLLGAWAADASFLKTQPGYISAQLHRGIGGSCCFMNIAVWESVAHFKQAFMHPTFQAHLLPTEHSSVAAPFLESRSPKYLCRRMNVLPDQTAQKAGHTSGWR